VGHNRFYEQVLLPMNSELMGKLVKVRITSATKFSMLGKPLNEVVMPGLVQPLEKGAVSGLKISKNDQKVSEKWLFSPIFD